MNSSRPGFAAAWKTEGAGVMRQVVLDVLRASPPAWRPGCLERMQLDLGWERHAWEHKWVHRPTGAIITDYDLVQL